MSLSFAASLLNTVADASSAASSIHSYIVPVLGVLDGVAALVCTIAVIYGGYLYMASSAEPERLDHAKRILRNAVIGIVIVLAATAATAILHHAYITPSPGTTTAIPALGQIQPQKTNGGWPTILIDALTGFFSEIVTSIASPLINELAKLTTSTVLMTTQPAVVNMWLVILAIANVLFILVLVLLGFRVMSGEMLGLGDIELRSLIPQIALVFVLMNVSIFAIDAVIGLNNAIISAIYAAFPGTNIWKALISSTVHIAGAPLVSLIMDVVFVVLAVMLFIYYVGRLIALFLGAALSPLVILLWLLPGFRDFANNLIRTYLVVIFVLLVHVVILMLAAAMLDSRNVGIANPFMDILIGIATILALLKTQGVLVQMSLISSGASSTRKMGRQFANGMGYTADKYAEHQMAGFRTQYALSVIGSIE